MTNSGQQGDVAWGAELVRSERTAGAEQAEKILVLLDCTLESHWMRMNSMSMALPGPVRAAFAGINSLLT